MESTLIAESFLRLREEKRAGRMSTCGNYLKFEHAISPQTGEVVGKRLADAQFCRERLCPMCAWRKSRVMFHQMSKILDWVQDKDPDLVPIFLTLAQRNVPAAELDSEIEKILKVGWQNLMKRRGIKRQVKGWFRALEVTYSKERDDFHPHIHAILLVPKSYFRKSNKDYLTQKNWIQLWRESMGLDYDPTADVRRIKNESSAKRGKAVAEAAKYTVKPGEWLSEEKELTDRNVSAMHFSLSGRRVIAFGGIMRDAKRTLKLEDVELADLRKAGEDPDDVFMREDIRKVAEIYRWQMGVTQYIRVKD